MATLKEIRESVTRAADWAIGQEPTNSALRMGLFLAYLAGRIEEREPELAAELDRVRKFKPAHSSEPAEA